MSEDWNAKPSVWPETIECGQDGCQEDAELVDDQGGGYCIYYCPVHDMMGVQFDSSDEYYEDEDDEYDDDLPDEAYMEYDDAMWDEGE